MVRALSWTRRAKMPPDGGNQRVCGGGNGKRGGRMQQFCNNKGGSFLRGLKPPKTQDPQDPPKTLWRQI